MLYFLIILLVQCFPLSIMFSLLVRIFNSVCNKLFLCDNHFAGETTRMFVAFINCEILPIKIKCYFSSQVSLFPSSLMPDSLFCNRFQFFVHTIRRKKKKKRIFGTFPSTAFHKNNRVTIQIVIC